MKLGIPLRSLKVMIKDNCEMVVKGNLDYFMSGRLIRLCHAAPDDVFHRVQSTASYGIVEGRYEDKGSSALSITLVRVPYDIEKAIQQAIESKMPDLEAYISELRTAKYRGKNS